MRILKSFMVGSAMAVFASGASFAADASGPEPSEFVRACDIYGSGFYYIPGSSSCMKIGGRVRLEFESTNFDADDGNDNSVFREGARVQFDVRNESDFGTVRAVYRTNGSTSRSTISIGDFLEFGLYDTFWARNNGYGAPVNRDVNYGYDDGIYAEIKANAGDADFTIGLESTNSGDAPDNDGDRDPNLYAGIKYTNGDWGWFAAHVLHESDSTDGFDTVTDSNSMTAPEANDDGDTAWGVVVQITAIENITLKGWYHGDGGETSIIGEHGDLALGQTGNDRQYGVGAKYSFGEWHIAGAYTAVKGASDEGNEMDQWTAQIGWDISSGLGAQLSYQDQNSTAPGAAAGTTAEDDGEQELMLRVTRSW